MTWELLTWKKRKEPKPLSLIDLITSASEDDLRRAIKVAKPGFHFSKNPAKKVERICETCSYYADCTITLIDGIPCSAWKEKVAT